MNTIMIIIMTLLCYSIISTITFLISGQKEEVLEFFGLGIFGLLLLGIAKVKCKVANFFRYDWNKRTIWEDRKTKERFKCKKEEDHNIYYGNYELIKRYAEKKEWENIPDFPEDVLEKLRRNCDNCKYNEIPECAADSNNPKCSHDPYGEVIAFDQFEKR